MVKKVFDKSHQMVSQKRFQLSVAKLFDNDGMPTRKISHDISFEYAYFPSAMTVI